jgi:hypothetical protein
MCFLPESQFYLPNLFSNINSLSISSVGSVLLIFLVICVAFMSSWPQKRDRMVVEFTTTCAINAYNYWSCEFEPCSWRGVLDTTYVIKFVSDLRQVGGFCRVLRFPPPIKLMCDKDSLQIYMFCHTLRLIKFVSLSNQIEIVQIHVYDKNEL